MPNYPYISGQGAVVQTFARLRSGVPPRVDAGYLQRANIAPANESYVISIIRFLGLIDEDGTPVPDNTQFLYGHDEAFKAGIEDRLRATYSQLFGEMGDAALEADKGELTHWFRMIDKSSEVVGQRQAATFQTLAALAGHGDLPTVRTNTTKKTAAAPNGTTKKTTTKKMAVKKTADVPVGEGDGHIKTQDAQGVGLTVRIEVNLPPGGDADTYDSIFASIKKHLMS